jgi:hypothetical protein
MSPIAVSLQTDPKNAQWNVRNRQFMRDGVNSRFHWFMQLFDSPKGDFT